MLAFILVALYVAGNAYFSYEASIDGESPGRIGALLLFGVFIKLYEKITELF
jgi:hypothetical protein